jgi:hypothetical protein
MPHFTILPLDQATRIAVEHESDNPETVLHLLRRIACHTADVIQDGEYAFSVRLAEGGCWTIFQRDFEPDHNNALG